MAGNGVSKAKDRHKGRGGDAPHPAVLQGPRPDAVRGVQHQGGHGRLEPEEDPGHQRHIAKAQVDPAQGDQDEQRGQHEQRTGHDPPGPLPEIPCSAWSLLNRTLVFISGTMDARGMRQWNSINRSVKKGSKALYILVPHLVKHAEDDRDVNQSRLLGFGVCPVFKVEDTQGEPLEYQNIEVPDLPLMDRALDWGISIKAVPGNYRYFGYYSSGRKEITLATSQECVLFPRTGSCRSPYYKGKPPTWAGPLTGNCG